MNAHRPRAAAAGQSGARLPAGALRELVHAHLLGHPDLDFSPSELANKLARSRGAISNALVRLAASDQAERTSNAPARYRATRA